jgi:hypothetical protein
MSSSQPQVSNVVSVGSPKALPIVRSIDTRRLDWQRVRRLGLGVFALQLLVLLVWSGVEAAHAVQAGDFVGFFHSFNAIAHGDLNPFGWWKSEGVFIQWPLAILGLIWDHQITLLVVQDFAIVGAEVVAFLWICELVAARDVSARVYCLTGLALLVLNPWIYWTASWDYHSESLGALFAILAARDLFRGRRIAWLWCLLTALSGMITVTYLAGIGISLLLVRRRRLTGLGLAIAAGVWFQVLVALGAGGGIGNGSRNNTPGAGASVGLGLSDRLSLMLHAVTSHWLDLISNVAPSGVIGAFTTPAFGITGLTLGENFSQGNPNPLIPSFQSLPVYVFVPVGTVVALMWVGRRYRPKISYWLAALLVLNVAGWGAVWLPKVIPAWLNVSMTQARTLRYLNGLIPQKDGVVVSEGVAGAFATHQITKMFTLTTRPLPIKPPYTWFIVVPYAGIEPVTINQSAEMIATLNRDPDAKLEYSNHGIWAYRVRVRPASPPPTFNVNTSLTQFSAALFRTAGTAVRKGNVKSWYVTGSNRAGGPVLWGDRFLQLVGNYRATVAIQGHGPARVEVWNDTTGKLLAHRDLQVNGTRRVSLNAAVTPSDPIRSDTVASGLAFFQIDPVPAFPGNYLEVVVYSTSSAKLKVRTVSLAARPPA